MDFLYLEKKLEQCKLVPMLGCEQNVKVLHDNNYNADDAKVIEIPLVFTESSRAKM